MRFDEVTVSVNAKLDVDQKTAETCLKLVEMFLNNHNDYFIQCTRNIDGTDSYDLARRCDNV